MIVRPLVESDLDAAMVIELAAHPQPWARPQLLEDLQRPGATLCGAFAADVLVGFIDFWRIPDEVQILNLATHPQHRRRGIASLLVEEAVTAARAHHALRVQLEVRRSNVAAIALYEKHHFRRVALRPNYYRDREDALIMIREL